MLGASNGSKPDPSPAYMNDNQLASYLNDLRANRVLRPTGARPAPSSKIAHAQHGDTKEPAIVATKEGRPWMAATKSMPIMPTRPSSIHPHSQIDANPRNRSPFVARPLARSPADLSRTRNGADHNAMLNRKPSANYLESGSRWMEKQEAQSLRQALEDMDLLEEQRVHKEAQDEASELVWHHQNQSKSSSAVEAPYANPDIKRDYRSHLRKGSYTRSLVPDTTSNISPLLSENSKHRRGNSEPSAHCQSVSLKSHDEKTSMRLSSPPKPAVNGPSKKKYGDLAAAVKKDIENARRRTSSGSRRVLSAGKRGFMNPQDRIWEDSEPEPGPPRIKKSIVDFNPSLPANIPASIRRSPFVRRAQLQQEKLERSNSAPVIAHARLDEVNTDGPEQCPDVSLSPSSRQAPSLLSFSADAQNEDTSSEELPTKNGKEIRGHDIRAATSKRRSERSSNLPQPTVVSDKPGRPIVSFQPDWRPRQINLEGVHITSPEPRPSEGYQRNNDPTNSDPRKASLSDTRAATCPPIPTISVTDVCTVPTIVLPEGNDEEDDKSPPIPTISIQPPTVQLPHGSTGPLKRPSPMPTLHHAATSPLPRSTIHVTPTIHQSRTLCAHCALPIAGRILSAAGSRFHPQCFVCHQCHTNLELVAFYPEPDQWRSERLKRISARQQYGGFQIPEGFTAQDMHEMELSDGDETPRFYCHLDYHELFSPRCKSCKTPIEGKIVVACGALWHEGHFFCAQCGDPFDASTPFVEKDGYAWCVDCHTNRYSSKCRKCRKPVTDVVIKALGSDWHNECFCCMECNGQFDDGLYFLRGSSEDPVCVKCEERRLKA